MRITNPTRLSLLAAALLAVTAAPAVAADLDGAKLFAEKTCNTCHGKDANTPIMPGYPAIGGQSEAYILQQMKDIKGGTRKNGQSEAMKAVMHLVSDEEMAAIAKYVSTLEYKPGLAASRLEKKDTAPSAAAPATTAPVASPPATTAPTSAAPATAAAPTPAAPATAAPATAAAPVATAPASGGDPLAAALQKIAAGGGAAAPAATAPALPPVAAAPATAGSTAPLPEKAAMTGKGGEGQRVWMAEGSEREEAMDLKPDLANGKDVYEVCAGCHLGEGWGKPDGTFPQLAGQHKEVLIKQLSDIRAKNRDNPTMYPFALPEAIGDAQALADVVGYIEGLPMNPENGKGEWAEGTPEFTKGKQLYADNCVKCHGEDGMGKAEKFYPRIDGQHYAYMLRQFEWIRDGKRRNANPEMVDQIKTFTDMDMKMVVNYASRLPVPKEDVAPSKDWKNPDFE